MFLFTPSPFEIMMNGTQCPAAVAQKISVADTSKNRPNLPAAFLCYYFCAIQFTADAGPAKNSSGAEIVFINNL
jgi:hypothetical protein